MTRPLVKTGLPLNRAPGPGAISAFDPSSNANLTVWLDAQTRTGWTMSGNDVITAVSEVGTPTFDCPVGARPTIVSVNSLDMMSFNPAQDDFMLHITNPAAVQPGSGDFTLVAVYRSTNAGRGLIWWKDDGAGRRWLFRVATGGSNLEWSVDDNTTAQTLVASDVDFANDDIYVVIATRRGDTLELFYGTGGALSESAASPFSLPVSYGSLGAGQSTIGNEMQVSPVQDFDGEMGELFFYNGEALGSAERTQLYNYLVAKWSL